MSVYNNGTCKTVTGSSTVKGNGTAFNTYVSAGDYFRLSGESTWYEVAAVVDATDLTLSSRYANTSYQTSRSEHVASVTTATKVYSGNFSNTPTIRNAVVMTASSDRKERFTDNGAGVLTGDQGGSGTISYDDGAYSVTLGTLIATTDLIASHYSGDSRNGLSYQVLKDFTSHYNLPEMSENDPGFVHIYTKSMRIIDSKMYTASANTVKASSYFRLGNHQYILGGNLNTQATIVSTATAIDASCKGSMYLSRDGELWLFDSDTSATRK